MREIRTLRSTWRGLATWHGIGLYRRASPRPYCIDCCGPSAIPKLEMLRRRCYLS